MKYDKLALMAAPVIPQYLINTKLEIPITTNPAKEAAAEMAMNQLKKLKNAALKTTNLVIRKTLCLSPKSKKV